MREIKLLKKEMLERKGWDKRKSVEIAIFATEVTLGNNLKDEAKNAREAKKLASGGLGLGGEADYFAAKAARLTIEAAKKKSEKKALKKAAKAIHAAALSKGWENPIYEGGMVGQYFIRKGDYSHELKRIRNQMKSIS
jgi:hypothetical protein